MINPNDYKIIIINNENIDNEHICCAIGNDRENQERSNQKKAWLKEAFKTGFVFKKYNIRGKVFIEYVPAENAWNPIEAPGYMFIDCFWVSGKYKGKGFGSILLNECEKDSKNKNGIVVLTSIKKKPFLADKKYFLKKGFEVCDQALPYFELLVKKNKNAINPKFKDSVKLMECPIKEGIVFYYTNHCAYSEAWANRLANYTNSKGLKSTILKINSKIEAQTAPTPFPTFTIFYNGQFLTHEILLEDKLDKLLK